MLIKLKYNSLQIIKTSFSETEKETVPTQINNISYHHPVSVKESEVITEITGKTGELYSVLYHLSVNYDIELM